MHFNRFFLKNEPLGYPKNTLSNENILILWLNSENRAIEVPQKFIPNFIQLGTLSKSKIGTISF